MSPIYFNIDLVGSCNLRCPSCPIGNSPGKLEHGQMSSDLLRSILAKAVSECRVSSVGLFNWTEPFIHPRLAEMIGVVNSFGLPCSLSSNLNLLRNVDEVLLANPHYLRISVSGFTQDTYGRTHAGGNIERVKDNMRTLSEAKARTGSKTAIQVVFHRYKDNQADELAMRRYARSLGFTFRPTWAYLMPVEKALSVVGADSAELTSQDRGLIDLLAYPLADAIAECGRGKNAPCSLQEEHITIDCFGRVQLCCAVYDPDRFTIGSYLETPFAELQRRKFNHDFCATCTSKGAHVYVTDATEMIATMAEHSIGPEKAKALGLPGERRRHRLQKTAFNLFNRTLRPLMSAKQVATLENMLRSIGIPV